MYDKTKYFIIIIKTKFCNLQWNMVCDNRWMGNFAQMSYMLGVFTGAVVLGSLADKYANTLNLFCQGIKYLILYINFNS